MCLQGSTRLVGARNVLTRIYQVTRGRECANKDLPGYYGQGMCKQGSTSLVRAGNVLTRIYQVSGVGNVLTRIYPFSRGRECANKDLPG